MKAFKKIMTTGTTLMLPLMAAAQGPVAPVAPDTANPLGQVLGLINRLTNWLLGALIVLAGLFVVYAAYVYLTAAGDPGKVGTAKNVLIYAVVAVAIGLLAKVAVQLAIALVS